MSDWLTVVWSAASPVAALAGAYFGARAVNRRQFRDSRRIEAAETIMALLYELQGDFFSWLNPCGFVGRPVDKHMEGQLFTRKLNRLTNYRKTHSLWLDTWASRETVEALDLTIQRLSSLSRDYFNTLPGIPYDEVNKLEQGTFPRHEEARERARCWLSDEMPSALERVDAGLIGRLGGARSSWRLRLFA